MVTPAATTTMERMLEASYKEATCKDGLIDFTARIRGDDTAKYSIKRTDLNHLFERSLWIPNHSGGHKEWKHPVTHVVVEYVDRHKDIDPGAVTTILEQVQKHLNILCNDIFRYTTDNWKEEPNYREAARRVLDGR